MYNEKTHPDTRPKDTRKERYTKIALWIMFGPLVVAIAIGTILAV
jgi:hypothetical protein